MEIFLYGILSQELLPPTFFANQHFHELVRTPFAVNLGILGALLVPFLAQSNVRGGLIGLSVFCLFVMTGIIFSGAVLATCCLIFGGARLLNWWSRKRGRAGLPYLMAWIFVNALYFPVFYVTYPPFEGRMEPGEIALFWGAGFMVFRAIHYLHLACRGWVNPFEKEAFSRFLHYMVHFPSFWFGPYQKFNQFDREVSTCKERINWDNRKRGAGRIGLGIVKCFLIFHLNLPFFYELNFYGPFADDLFAGDHALDPLQIWMFMALFMLRIALFISAISDGVIGMNLMMGIRVPENSNWPIFARDIPEFWRRWHIQVTVFLREEVFIPVSGMRHRVRGFFCVFAYSGIWHFPSIFAALAFPLLHLALFEAAMAWKAFWKYHKSQDDWIHRAGLRYKLHDSWLSGGVGIVFTMNVNVFSALFILDHLYGGTRLLTRIFGF